jgi:catechol 2,3-dioxygenase-like lactoylglutathione lyase family enzyme
MSDVSIERPARRFLHICYCCPDVYAVTEFMVDGLHLEAVMRTTDEYSSGAILGLDHQVRSIAQFVYDVRGPRVSPSIEIQGWIDPAPVGEPSLDATEIGIKALGFAVPSVDDAVIRLTGMGCTVVSDGSSEIDDRQAVLRDPRGVTLELVQDASLAEDASQMHHLRVTVASMDDSVPFYEMLGFEVLERTKVTDGSFVGAPAEVEAECVRLRLPDEPFEVRLVQWSSPAGHGRHPADPFHAGLFRAALGVDDTRASYEYLTGAGETFLRPPMSIELSGTPVPDMWITFIADPNGVPYEFVQRPRSAFR